MASRNGSAMAVPAPRSIARREIRLLGFMPNSFRSPPHPEWSALYDCDYEAGKPAAAGGRLPPDVLERGRVGCFQASPEGEREHLPGEIAREQVRLRAKH